MASQSTADSRSAKLQNAYQNLATASTALNFASDQLSNAVSTLDEALNKLSPGVSAWITFDHWFHEDEAPGIRHEERLGFAKTNNRWGLSLCRVEIDTDENDEESTSDAWLFNDAPRNMRLKAIEHLPDLVEALAREAEQTAKKVVAGANLATNLVRSVNSGTKERGQ